MTIRTKNCRLRAAAIVMAVLLLAAMMPAAAFAEDTPVITDEYDDDTPVTEPEDETAEPDADVPGESPELPAATPEDGQEDAGQPEQTGGLSEPAQAFVDAVHALDRESILAAVNAWVLASRAWQEVPENPERIAALDEAIAAADAAAAPAYTADDLYCELTDEDRETDEVKTAYTSLAALFAAMQMAMDHPTAPEDDEPSPEDEIARMLYGELPDKPTGSYIGRYGLPVATGETRIGIGLWKDEQAGAQIGYMDTEALYGDDLTITVPRLAGEAYAVAPIMVEVEYPANGSRSEIILPDNVTLLDCAGNEADARSAEKLLTGSYIESSAGIAGICVMASEDFTARFRYSGPDGNTLEKHLNVRLEGETPLAAAAYGAGTYGERPTPAVTTGKITSVQKVNGTWLIWFNGEEAYCCTIGAQGKPDGCPTYTYTDTSIVTADQITPGDHYANQVNIWGGLGELSLGVWSAGDGGNSISGDAMEWIVSEYPDSVAAQCFVRAMSGASVYAAASDYYTYIYTPAAAGWQTVAVIGPPVDGDDEGGDTPQEYYADWSASPQTASGSFDARYTVNTDKVQLDTGEKVDGAVIEIEPLRTGGTIDGGTWSLTPAGKQTVTTGGHTMNDSYHLTGGDASASWSLHYSVSKTSTSGRSGRVGPYSSQAEANAAAASAKSSAEAELRAEAQGMVNRAIAAAKNDLAAIDFRFCETVIPVGFIFYDGEHGGSQTISVGMNTGNDYIMRNDEWGLKVRIRKVDAETGRQIAADAKYEVFEWDVVSGQYIPHGGYNQYSVARKPDGTYMVVNGSGYATNAEQKETLYFTQRNEGRFLVVETQSPANYYGDWTDIEHPGQAGTPLGKRAYYIEITADNDGSVIWLDNMDYNADIAAAYTGGTSLRTADGDEATVTIHSRPLDAGRTYATDSTGLANNEDSYDFVPQESIFKNVRVLGEIRLSKVDLDAARYLDDSGRHGDAVLDGAVYDLYAAEDIRHPDGVTGVVDYSAILDADGNPVWHTTVRTNSGWNDGYLPVLCKDDLVASAEIRDGQLVIGNLYLGRYYLVERATGLVLPVDADGQFYCSGQYPECNRRLEPTGRYIPLEKSGSGEYSAYIYKNQYSAVAQSRALNGTKTYDGYYLSFAEGYLCDEVNHYQTLAYGSEAGYVVHEQQESPDAVLKSGFALKKLVSTTGPGSPAPKLEGAGFTVYLISALSRADRFARNPDGSYDIQSVLEAYRKDDYDNETVKYDFSGEEQAIARMYESDADLVYAYNAALTADGDNANGSGQGWVPTRRPDEYRLSEIFTNDEGVFRVNGLAYGQYLVVETSIPKDVFQCNPFVVKVDSAAPQSLFCRPNGSVTTPSGSYMTFNILDEEMEGYLQLAKTDAETGKAVKLENTSFALYRIRPDGSRERLSMIDPASGDAAAKTDVFRTDAEGRMKTPEKLPLGRYLIEELQGPNGFYNDRAYSVAFEITSERVWQVIGNAVDDMDEYIITERYINRETLGRLTIKKTGEVLTGWQQETDGLPDPILPGAARPGHFVYEDRPLAGAEYTITAAEDIYTQDRQTDSGGNRTLWYAQGDVVAVVTTGDGGIDTVNYAPIRTGATNDFLSVVHDGAPGEVTVTLPLGGYQVRESAPPYGFAGTDKVYDVSFDWEHQYQEIIDAPSALEYHNERAKAEVQVLKVDSKTEQPLAGAVFNLYTVGDIYSADGDLLFEAGALVATSAPTGEDGTVVFDCDIQIRSEGYADGEGLNSSCWYIRELKAPDGYFLSDQIMDFVFLYDGTAVQTLESTSRNDGTGVFISKRKLTGSDELPGASLTIQDSDGNTVRSWVSGEKPREIRGLLLDTVYTLVEVTAPDGFAKAESIRFRLVQRRDEDGSLLNENDVYVCTGKDWLIIDHWTRMEDGTVVMRDAPAPKPAPEPSTPGPKPEQPSEPAPTPAPAAPVPVAAVPQTGALPWLAAMLGGTAVIAVFGLLLLHGRREDESQPGE